MSTWTNSFTSRLTSRAIWPLTSTFATYLDTFMVSDECYRHMSTLHPFYHLNSKTAQCFELKSLSLICIDPIEKAGCPDPSTIVPISKPSWTRQRESSNSILEKKLIQLTLDLRTIHANQLQLFTIQRVGAEQTFGLTLRPSLLSMALGRGFTKQRDICMRGS